MNTKENISDRFTPIAKFNVEDIAKGHYYKSNLTGIQVLVSEIDGPKIDAYICVGTKVDSNDGVAHTLEHLVFTGSKRYQMRGILDRLANRCFAQGTNAWTSIDQTVYVISTASQEGLINILPVYLDHIMNPILQDDTFKTEVYQVKEDGTEAGVVFSEMQAKENSEFSITYRANMNQLFKPQTGYCFNSGGELQSIRQLTLEKVIAFHKKYYRPDNMVIVITGAINTAEIMDGIKVAEDLILSEYKTSEQFERPWNNVDIEPPTYGVVEKKFPCESDSSGTLLITIQGPLKNNILEYLALNALANYMVYFDESPLKAQFVIKKSLCSGIVYTILRLKQLYLQLKFFNVNSDNMDKIIEGVKSFITTIKTDGFDIEFLKKVISFEYYYFVNEFEENPHSYIATKGIEFFLYGTQPLDLLELMEERNLYHDLFAKGDSFWMNFFNIYFHIDCLVIVKGIGEKRKESNNEGLILHKHQTSERKTLEEHHQNEQIPLSENLMKEFPIPKMHDVCFHKITTVCNFGSFDFENLSLHGFEVFSVPLAMQIDDIKSNILQISLCVCLGKVNNELIPLLNIFSQMPIEMPIVRKGILLSPDIVKKQLDLIFFSRLSSISWNSSAYELGIMSYYYFLSLKTDVYHYEDAVSWIRDLLFNFQFDIQSIKSIVLQNIQKLKNVSGDGAGAVIGLSNFITFRKNTVNHCLSLFYQINYLQNLYQLLQSNPEEVKEKFYKLNDSLKTDSNIQAHLMCDFKKLNSLSPNPHSQWQLNFSKYAQYNSHTPRTASNFNQDFVECEHFSHMIIATSPTDSSYLIQTISCIRSYRDPDFPILAVLLELLSGFEGPLWKRIRGKGLAYATVIYCEPSDGLIYVKISKSTNIVEAYRELRNTLLSFLKEENGFTQEAIESAISGVIFEVINQESNICDAGLQNMLAQLKGLDYEFHKYFINKVTNVEKNGMKRVANKYFPCILDTTKSHIAVCGHRSKSDEIRTGFKSMNVELTVYQPPPIKDLVG